MSLKHRAQSLLHVAKLFEEGMVSWESSHGKSDVFHIGQEQIYKKNSVIPALS